MSDMASGEMIIDTGLSQKEREMYERRIANLQQQLETTMQTLRDERAMHIEQLRVLQQRMDAEHRYYLQQISALQEIGSSSAAMRNL